MISGRDLKTLIFKKNILKIKKKYVNGMVIS